MGKLSAAVVVAAVSTAARAADVYETAFDAFVEKYGKIYASAEERSTRFTAFKRNYDIVAAENAKEHSYKLELNLFADQPSENFGSGRLGLSVPHTSKLWLGAPHLGTDEYSGAELPSSVDWVKDGAVTTPKNQGSCGSCWTFSTSGALEGAWKISTGKLVSLSEQQFVDCSKNDGNNGCNGGSMDAAFTYLESSHGVCTEESYKYVGKSNGVCKETNCTLEVPKGAVTGYKDVPVQDLNALMEAVAQQPVSVGIEADQTAFQLYSGGVLTKECGSKLDHGVLLVGYGTDNGVDYWKIKNSWGPAWGENGFIRLERNKTKDGECGVKLMASYPVIQDLEQRTEKYDIAFQEFVKKYDKDYATVEERATAFAAFKESYDYVQSINSANRTYKVELNSFADQSPSQFGGSGRLGLSAPSKNSFAMLWAGAPHLGTDLYSGAPLPSDVDWVAKGAVTKPKNQKTCGSCWTFSTTGALEGAWRIAGGELLSLSEQQLVDCSKNDGNAGCSGGSMDAAFTYLEQNALCTEASYPYAAKQGACHASNCTAGIPRGAVTGFKDVPQDEKALMEAVAQQPVSVGIEADQMAFQLYKGGILTKECGDKLDHGVLVVGYGTDQGVDYWKIKNSWGPSWGETGYIRIERGLKADGECGVKAMASYPVVSKGAREVVV